MQHFSRSLQKLPLGRFGLLFIFAIFITSSVVSLLTNTTPAFAANTYSYADNGSKIVLKKPSGTTYIIAKSPIQKDGKDKYEGSVRISGPNGVDCNIGVQILVTTGGTSATISAPAVLNGLPGAGAVGGNNIGSCPKDFAAASSEYNASINIGAASTDTPTPTGPETDGQKEGVVTVYSKTSDHPQAIITLTTAASPRGDKKNIVWNENASVGSVRWSNLVAGTSYKFCVEPVDLFDSVNCKSGTKEAGKALLIQFGTFEGSFNPTGKQVKVKVNIDIPAAPSASTYGPVALTIYSAATGLQSGTGETASQTIGTDVTTAQKITLVGLIDNVEPGQYKVCVTGNDKLCSETFTKEVNLGGEASIDISAEDSKNFLSSAGTSCGVDGIGWIVCPILSFTGDLLSGAFSGLADNFLVTDISLFSTNSGTFQAWSIFRNFANVAFVIAFLIIIFSQLTSVGVSNYGVKKLLPRIVIAAILVNLSYFICQVAVDISNILGYSLKGLFDGIATAANVKSPTDASADGFGISAIVLAVIATATVSYFVLPILIPILLGALVAVLMIVLLLIARKALIILLIVLSPLAFVAFLLPNTESLFTKWRKAFTTLLLLFPIVAIVFGVSSLASQIILSAGPGTGSAVTLQIMAVGIAALPLFMVPTLLKGSLDGIGTIGAKMNGFASKAGGNLGKAGGKGFENSRLGQFQNYRKGERKLRRAQIQSGTYAGKGVRGLMSRANRKINESKFSGKFGDRALTTGYSLADKENDELTSNASSRLDNMVLDGAPLSQRQMIEVSTGQDVTDGNGRVLASKSSFDENSRKAALQKATKIATVAEAHTLVNASSSMSLGERKVLSQSLGASSVLTKAPYLGGKTLGQIEQGTASTRAASTAAIAEDKVTAEVLANGNKDSATELLAAAMATPQGSQERIKLKAAYNELNKPDSRLREKIVAGGDHDQVLQGIQSL